mgnify:CR=1 FL=1
MCEAVEGHPLAGVRTPVLRASRGRQKQIDCGFCSIASWMHCRANSSRIAAERTGYALAMKATMKPLQGALLYPLLAGFAGLVVSTGSAPAAFAAVPIDQITQRLDAIVERIPTIPEATRLRRSLAHATFCLPQNVLGILYYGLLQATGNVLEIREMNETTIVVTRTPAGASLGRYVFVSLPLLTEATVRHEYGHTMQGYRHGPFYLLFEGVTSFVQAAISIVSPRYAAGYFDRWPENEANRLGGVQF